MAVKRTKDGKLQYIRKDGTVAASVDAAWSKTENSSTDAGAASGTKTSGVVRTTDGKLQYVRKDGSVAGAVDSQWNKPKKYTVPKAEMPMKDPFTEPVWYESPKVEAAAPAAPAPDLNAMKQQMDELADRIAVLKYDNSTLGDISKQTELFGYQTQYNNLKKDYEAAKAAKWYEERQKEIEEADSKSRSDVMGDLRRAAELMALDQAERQAMAAPGVGNIHTSVEDELNAAKARLPEGTNQDWLEYARQMSERETYEKSVAEAREFAESNPVGASAASVPMNLMSGAGVIDTIGRKLGYAITGSDAPVNYQSAAMIPNAAAQEIRATVSEDMGAAGSAIYNLGMSMADSLGIIGMSLMGIPGGTALLGGSAAASGMRNAAERGATDGQAIALGLLNGAAEMLFEKIPIENLLKKFSGKGIKDVVWTILKQGITEAGEEVLTTLANTMTDMLVMGDKNELAQRKRELMTQYSEEEANRIAGTEWFMGLGMDLLGGLVSGLTFGSGGVAIQSAFNAWSAKNNPQTAAADTPVETLQEAAEAVTNSREEVVPAAANEAQAQAEPAVAAQPQQQADNVQRMNESAARSFGETGQKAFQTLNDGTADPLDLYAGFAVYHKAGMSGQDINSVKSQYAENLSEQHRQIAYDAGVQDAAALRNNVNIGIENQDTQSYTNSENMTEVLNYGEEVHLRNSSQWAGGQNSGGQVSAVEAGAGRNQSWQTEAVAADSAAASLSYGEKVSTASLGVPGGSTEANIRIVTGGQTAATRAAMKTAKANGLQLTLFVGDNLQIGNVSGKMYSVRAYISGNKVYVRADHPVYTADQLMRHETGHAKIARGEIDPNTVRERIAQEYGDEHVDYLAEKYAEAYEGTGLTADEIWEEAICDSLADMNIFKEYSDEWRTAEVILNEVKESAETETQAARGPPAEDTNVPGNTSIETLPDGKKYVRADRQVVMGNDPESWSEQLEDYINKKIRKGENVQLIAEDGDILTLTPRTAGKVSSMYNNDGTTMDERAYERKVNAGAHIDELARISVRDKKTKNDIGGRHGDTASDGWHYRTAYFRDFDGKYYLCTISVEMGTDGNAVYNIGKMQERSFPEISGSSAKGGAQGGKTSFEKIIEPAAAKVKGKFSMETSVEQTETLIAMHNMDEEKLRRTLQLGAWPSPSVAIVQATQGHETYGEYSAIFPRSTIDPEADYRNKVYGSDAWTPTHSNARVEYEVDTDVKWEFESNIETLAKDVAGGIFAQNGVLDMAGVGSETDMSLQDIAHKLATRYDSVRAAYLADKGGDIEIAYRTKEFDRFGNDALKSYIDKMGEQEVARLAAKMLTGERLDAAEIETAKDAIMEHWTAKNEWRLKQKPDLRDIRIAKQRDKLSDLRAEDFVRNAWEFYEDSGATTDEVNRMETAENLRHAVDDKAVEAWTLDMLQGLLGAPGIYNGRDAFDAKGNRRNFRDTHWEYNVENIVRAMNNTQGRGANMWGISGSGLVATATPEYQSVEEIHADEKRLKSVPKNEYDQMMRDLDEELERVTGDIMRDTEHHSDNRFDEEQIIGSVIAEAAQGSRTVASVKRTFQKEGYRISDTHAKAILKLLKHAGDVPSAYFEAKPQRVVGFEEALAVVAPANAPADLMDAMRSAGMNVLTYEAGNDVDRLAKVNGVEGAKFSRELDNLGNRLSEGQQAFFKDSKVRDEDGNLLVMYHGTPNGGFTRFRSGTYFTQDPEYAEVYQSPSASSISVKRNADNPQTYQVYLNIKKPFDTRNPKERKIFINEYYRKYGTGTPLADSGLPDWVDGMDLQEFIEEMEYDYDGLILDEGGTGGYGEEVKSRGLSYVVFSSEQVKNVSNLNPTSDPDIRYSRELENLEELRKQNLALQKQVEYWKGQTKLTTRETATLRQGDIDKLARRIIKDFSSTLKAEDISGSLKDLGEYILRDGDGKNELTWPEVKDRAVSIAREVAQNAKVLRNEAWQEYSDLRKYLKTTTIVFGKEYQSEIADYKDFRKRNSSRLHLVGGEGTNVDQVYKELAEHWPGFFNEEAISNPADQLLHIDEVLESLKPIYENPHSLHMAEATEYLANDIIDSLLSESIRQSPKTYADKQAEKLSKQRADAKLAMKEAKADARENLKTAKKESFLAGQMYQGQKMAEAMRREVASRDKKLEDLKKHYAEVAERKQARAADSKSRTRLLNIAKRLQNKKLPAVSRALLDQYIGELDTVSKSMTSKSLEKLFDLRDWYDDQKANNPDFIADPRIEKALQRLSKRQINELSAKEVRDLTEVLLNIENQLRYMDKLTDSLEKRSVQAMGMQIIADVESTRGSKTGIPGIPSKYIVTETLSPIRMIRRMTGYVDNDPLYTVANELADGQRKQMDFQRRAGELFKKWIEDKKFSQSIAGENAQWVEITGIGADGKAKKVNITPAMRMSLYLHSLNSDNMRHIANGGVRIPDMKLYKKGKIADAYDRGTIVRLTPSMVRGITQNMTEKEMAFARAASRYFNGMSQTEINEVSEKLKGYSLAQVENYFPINTDTNFSTRDFEALKFDGTIEGMGFLKERVQSTKPIMLRDMNSVLTQSIDMTSKYVGLAIPVRNFNKVWGVTKASFDKEGKRTGYESSVQEAIKQKWGSDGYKYIENMMTDLNAGRPATDVWAKAMNKIKGNYAGAVLTLNPGVALKQYGAWFSAGSVLGFNPLAKAAFSKNVDINIINKYTPLLWYRAQGFSTQELGDMAKNDKRLPKWLDWLSGTDVQITTKLWKAAEHYVRKHNKDLTFGTDAFYKAVAEVYNRTIEETQPNYTTMQRPQLLRSENTLMQNLSMFKTDAFQSFNVLYDAMGNLHAKKNAYTNSGTEEAKAAYREAKQAAGRAVSAQFMQLALVAGVQVVWNLVRGKREKYEDEEDKITVGSVVGEMGKDMLGGVMSFVPFGSDAWELVSSKLFDETYYGMDAVTVQALTDAVKSISGLTELFSGTAKALAKKEKVDWKETALAADNYFDDFSKAFGIPYENVVNAFNAVYLNSAKWAKGKYLGTYAAMKLTTGYESGTGDYYDLLWKTLKAGDMDAYNTISKDLQENIEQYEMSGESIISAMKSRYNKAVKENSDFKLPQRAADAIGVRGKYAEDEEEDTFGADDLGADAYQKYINEQADTYRTVFDEIQSYDSFDSIDAEAKDKLLAAADKLAKKTALENAADGEYQVDVKWINWARNGENAGVSEAEAILFKVAYDMSESDYDKRTGKAVTGSKKKNTLELAREWMPDLTSSELKYLKSNYWQE